MFIINIYILRCISNPHFKTSIRAYEESFDEENLLEILKSHIHKLERKLFVQPCPLLSYWWNEFFCDWTPQQNLKYLIERDLADVTDARRNCSFLVDRGGWSVKLEPIHKGIESLPQTQIL